MKSSKLLVLPVSLILSSLLLIHAQPMVLAQAAPTPPNPPAMVQVSTYDYFAAGGYDGFMSIANLHKYGDFGLGTFDKVDGEMVEVDGQIYQIRPDGKPHLADDTSLTPFANVTFWHPAPAVPVAAGLTMTQLEAQLDQVAPDQNVFVAIRVEGNFKTLKLRSEAPASKPYPALADFLKTQTVFNLTNIQGTLVGVRSPAFSKGINVVGYHFHFLSTDRQAGGHVLDLTTDSDSLEVNADPVWEIYLPESAAAVQANATATVSATN